MMRPMAEFRSKKHRLPDAMYRGQKNVAFTAAVEGRRPLFRDAGVVEAMLPVLAAETVRRECLVGIYCFMPDHLHLILCGQSDRADAKAAMDAFKTQTGRWLGANRPGACWQDGYHDHVIRKGDDWRRQVRYVVLNPVRAGLVADPAAWPHTGAIGFDLVELMIDADY